MSPSIIKQNRVGLHGKQFQMYKFRTMKNYAHLFRRDLDDLNKNDNVIFKIDDDPRIIKGAQFLRNLSFDELPQFFNVLFEEMSIVGPRPLFSEDTLLFDEKLYEEIKCSSGNYWIMLQINERNTSEFCNLVQI